MKIPHPDHDCLIEETKLAATPPTNHVRRMRLEKLAEFWVERRDSSRANEQWHREGMNDARENAEHADWTYREMLRLLQAEPPTGSAETPGEAGTSGPAVESAAAS